MNVLIKYSALLMAMALMACGGNSTDTNSPAAPTQKLAATDPFKNSIVPSEEFTVNTGQDNVVQGKSGTVVVMPKGCFLNSNGNVVEGNVKVELAEALALDEMLLSNLTTTADGKLLETDGMIYINATANGEQLTINKDNPLYIEMPTPRKKPGMMLYTGTRDSLGNMNWKDPKKLENYLVTVSLDKLDFLPKGFALEVEKGMPFRKHKKATEKLTDSLYYCLSGRSQWEFYTYVPAVNDIPNEPLFNQSGSISYNDATAKVTSDTTSHEHGEASEPIECGIDPAIIKTLKSPQYKNTFIATREFEARLQVIFKTCRKGIIDSYINNLDKNLFEVDSIVALKLRGTEFEDDFIAFKNQRHGKVKNANKHAALLNGFYDKKLAENKAELDAARDKYQAQLQKATDDFEKVKEEYKGLLVKREKYRMETYGFVATATGWLNIDIGTVAKEWDYQNTEITVEGGKTYDRTYTYIIFTSIKSLVRLNTGDNELFYTGKITDKRMYMPKNKTAVAIGVAWKGEQMYFTVKEFTTVDKTRLTIALKEGKNKEFKAALKPYENYLTENKIDEDLKYMEKFYKEHLRLKKLAKENEFMLKLWHIAYPCCADEPREMK